MGAIQASPCCRLTMMIGITVLVLLGHLIIETEAAWNCSMFHLKPESAALDYCEKMQKVIRKKNLDCESSGEIDPDVIVDCGSSFIPLNIYSVDLTNHVSCEIEDDCDDIWKDIYQKVKVKKTELEGILKEHKEHLDVVRKLAKKVAKLNNSSLLHGLNMQMFNLINFKDPERGFTMVIKNIEVKLKEMKKEMIKRIVKRELKEEMKQEKEMIKNMVKKELKEKMKKKKVMRKKKEMRKKMKTKKKYLA